jgi:hypothetical protein
MEKVDYSLFIKKPSPDIKAEGHEQFHATIAIKNIDALGEIGFNVDGVPLMPAFVVTFFRLAILAGHYRVELLLGETEYKLYRKFRENDPGPFMVLDANNLAPREIHKDSNRPIHLNWTNKHKVSILYGAYYEDGKDLNEEELKTICDELIAQGWKESEHSRK